jgi:putative membrane protein
MTTSHPAARPSRPDWTDLRGDRALAASMLIGAALLLVWSGIRPKEYVTWALEVSPAVAGAAVLWATYGRFRFTPLVYVLTGLHAALLIVGGHYTYAEVPVGNWARDALDLSRNHYDRVGHFVQGFVPALITREVLLRLTPLRRGGWLFFLVTAACLGISAAYELIEWGVAEIDSGGSTAFLGTQGDVWDTQKDMALCLVGALLAQVTLSAWQDRQLAARTTGPGRPGPA